MDALEAGEGYDEDGGCGCDEGIVEDSMKGGGERGCGGRIFERVGC